VAFSRNTSADGGLRLVGIATCLFGFAAFWGLLHVCGILFRWAGLAGRQVAAAAAAEATAKKTIVTIM
jgi:hypothetical protein